MRSAVAEPERVARLEHDERGYPIPWNVLRGTDGTPFFIVNDDRKAWRALRAELCPICGERLGSWRWFVGGPQSAFHPAGCYFDLPGHRECVEYALQVCPYLAIPKYLRHTDAVANAEKLPAEARLLLDETILPDRPEVMVAVCASGIELLERGRLQPYLKPVPPFRGWSFWRHGKRLGDAEALPYLKASLGEEFVLPPLEAK